MKILTLDLGTDTGYALEVPGEDLVCDTIKLGTAKEITEWGKNRLTRRCEPRVIRFLYFLKGIKEESNPDLVVFEDVQFQSYTYQTQLWASFRACVWAVFHDTTIECVATGILKKFATGSSFADKEKMAECLYRLAPHLKSLNLNDDAVDAYWLLHWSKKHLSQCQIKPSFQ